MTEMNLRKQAMSLSNSLAEFDATVAAPQQLINIFNVILQETKNLYGDHPIVAAIEPVEPHGMGMSINAGGLRALVEQLLDVIPRS